MNKKEFWDIRGAVAGAATRVMKDKQGDYANKKNVLANFERHGAYGVVVRMGDKEGRLTELLYPAREIPVLVEDETLLDTAIDMRNYADILIAKMVESGQVTMDEIESKARTTISSLPYADRSSAQRAL